MVWGRPDPGLLLFLLGLSLTITSAGCTTLVAPAQQGPATESSQRCIPAMTKRARAVSAKLHEAPVEATAPASSRFSAEALRVADIIGVMPVLNRIAALEASPRQEPLDMLISRQRLTDQVLLTLFEVASSTAELTCERDRADQVADRIDEIDNARVKRLTIASIVLGGIAGIISGGVGLAAGASTAGEAADVAGGVLASWFGVSALFTHSEVEFRHDRNALQELWADPPDPHIFSPIVWRYLHRAHAAGTDRPREQVLNAWRQGGRLGESGSKKEQQRQALFFGAGGRYAAAELRARASMLETLEASIRLMHEELEVLLREIADHPVDAPQQES
jgi:hypothetical protein